MLPTPDEEDIPLRHRPLPSVDIALLPHELRAIRMQRRALIGGVLGLVMIVLGLAYGKALWAHLRRPSRPRESELSARESSPNTTSTLAATSPEAAAIPQRKTSNVASQPRRIPPPSIDPQRVAPPAPPLHLVAPISTASTSDGEGDGAKSRIETKFGGAKSFHQALLLGGASAEEASELIAALGKLVDFRRGKPGDRFVFERDPDRQLRAFEYRASVTEIYRAVRDEAGALRGLRVEVPIEHKRVAKGIYIAGSLGHSLSALGLGPQLAGMVTEAFGSRISFTKDTRTGDSVKLIVDEEYVDGAFLRYGNVHAIEYASERAGKLQAFWFEDQPGDGDYYDANARALNGGWLRTPLRYDHVSSPYNLKRRHPILKRIMPHLGIDYAASTGTPVWAAADGVVTFTGKRGANGNLVSVRHGNGYESHYAHLWKIGAGIKPGTKLKQRQVIGFVGSTGRSTGPHLHFAMKRGDRYVDPVSLLNGPGEPLPSALIPHFRAEAQRLRAELEHIPLAPAPSDDGDGKNDDADDDEDVDL